MILQVENGDKLAIEGVAQAAYIGVKGDTATVAVAAGDLIATPRIGHTFKALNATWEFAGGASRSRAVTTFTYRRIVSG